MSLTAETARYDLAESVGPDLVVRELLADGCDDAFGMISLGYGPTAGVPRLRQRIAEHHGVDADDVVITVGGMHALFLVAFILCDPGDEAVTTTPLFPNARATLDAVGAKVTEVPVTFETGYRLDVEALSARLTPQTRLVSLASPQNPSGVAVPQETLGEIAVLMQRVCPEAILLVDETYRDAAYGRNAIAPSAVTLAPNVVTIGSLSKCHGAPALRIGWAVTRNPALRDQLIRGKFNTAICNSGIDEALAVRVLDSVDNILLKRRDHLHEGLTLTARWVEDNADLVSWVRPDAGALCAIRLDPETFDAAAVQRFHETLAAHGVRVAPGPWFGDAPHVFRFGFGLLPIADLMAGLDRMTTALRGSARQAA